MRLRDALIYCQSAPLRRRIVLCSLGLISIAAAALMLVNPPLVVQRIRGSSMEPLLKDGSIIVSVPRRWWRQAPSRNDIVVMVAPWADSRYAVKRVAGVEGDCMMPDGALAAASETKCYLVGSARYFVTGDNSHRSVDSREIGDVSERDVVATVHAVLWPEVRVF